MIRREYFLIGLSIATMAVYFFMATPVMMDDGFHYEGFTEALARGKLDFGSFYGFQGMSILSVPVFWLTGSHDSIVIASMMFALLSIPLAYYIGKDLHGSRWAGIYFLVLFLLTPYPYTTMMRGFQEAALLFFILLILCAGSGKKIWTPFTWAVGGMVKPFALVLFPLFIKDFWNKKFMVIVAALMVGGVYLGLNYYQTGHFVNNAAINSYQGNFEAGAPPPLKESFVLGTKGFLRVAANFMIHSRKILISPLVIILGALSLLYNKVPRYRKEIITAIGLNILLVGSLTFSFPKYLLPAVVLFALAAVPILMRYPWLMVAVLIDSLFVFIPIWDYFGRLFWSNIYLYLLPFYLGVILFVYERLRSKYYPHSDS